jgi:hypothetical protein
MQSFRIDSGAIHAVAGALAEADKPRASGAPALIRSHPRDGEPAVEDSASLERRESAPPRAIGHLVSLNCTKSPFVGVRACPLFLLIFEINCVLLYFNVRDCVPQSTSKCGTRCGTSYGATQRADRPDGKDREA